MSRRNKMSKCAEDSSKRTCTTRRKELKVVLTILWQTRLDWCQHCYHKLPMTTVISLTHSATLIPHSSKMHAVCSCLPHNVLVNSPYQQPTNLLARPHRCKQSSPSLIMGVALPGDHQLHLRCTLPA